MHLLASQTKLPEESINMQSSEVFLDAEFERLRSAIAQANEAMSRGLMPTIRRLVDADRYEDVGRLCVQAERLYYTIKNFGHTDNEIQERLAEIHLRESNIYVARAADAVLHQIGDRYECTFDGDLIRAAKLYEQAGDITGESYFFERAIDVYKRTVEECNKPTSVPSESIGDVGWLPEFGFSWVMGKLTNEIRAVERVEALSYEMAAKQAATPSEAISLYKKAMSVYKRDVRTSYDYSVSYYNAIRSDGVFWKMLDERKKHVERYQRIVEKLERKCLRS